MQGWVNMQKSTKVTHHNNRINVENHKIILIDAKKASKITPNKFEIEVPKSDKEHLQKATS